MPRGLTIALLLAWPVAAQAQSLPPRLTGAWHGTAPDKPTQSVDLYLAADGLGLMVGSVEATPMPGAVIEPGKPAPRIVAGLPARATLEGQTLTLQPFLPGAKPEPVKPMAQPAFTCQVDDPSMTCSGPDRSNFVLTRTGESLPDDAAAMIGQLRAAAPHS